YTPVGRDVMFFDITTNRVMLVTFDVEVEPHPFIQPAATTQSIQWVIDQQEIAWTQTDATETGSLTTQTYVAALDGSNSRVVLNDGPRSGIAAMPVAFNKDHTILYMDYQPTVGAITPFQQYAGLFAVDLGTEETELLPGEPGCFCGAAFSAGLFARLELTEDQAGFDLHVYNLAGEVDTVVPAVKLQGYTQAGDLTLSPDGKRAIYALADIRDFGGPNEFVRTIYVLANLEDQTQTALTSPITSFVRPVKWTEDNSALIFTSPEDNGTWKINLDEGRLNRIASATYIGTLK
ncbi:MAG: hypothetical protein K8L99_29560, partial [Anaerolineae bacterium]|nr:hypothetical protein [Anaerolineae bacterium]